MGIVLSNLKAAYNKNAIVNVYRLDEIFFTGYVYLLDEDSEELVMRTYDEWGMPDGMVYLDLSMVYDVEVDNSADLRHMKRRIQLAKDYHFKEIAENKLMPLDKLASLRLEILGRSYVDGQIVMITIDNPEGIDNTYKGLIDSVDAEKVEITVVNKTNFSDHTKHTLDLSAIMTIEFLGKELTMLTKNKELLFGPSIETVEVHGDAPQIPTIFEHSRAKHQLFEIESAADNGYYYIGYVVNYNEEFVIFNLVTMSGQFGGYVLLRTSMVTHIYTDSDYLRLINQFTSENKAADTFLEPVLNDERVFDMKSDPLATLLEQAINLNRLVRVAAPKSMGLLGYPLDITPITKQVHFQEVDDTREGLEKPVAMPLSQIGELAFDYLEAFLTDDGLKNQREI
ncbi:hypothetical protein [Lactobacillus sp. Sy-1]|uniref:hypothetical protein n=1 Tax=Lactobacillus sp. Sy-1 TaxID=2109645 RepID=UPI001C574C37|nr:hypothetical protein [Lactobacillus sp. Sy-1]MBW1605251.1 hypothetical protein [Lactobacillus sp. Sy-1]